MESFIINNLTIIFGLSIAILYFCHRLHIPIIVGFLFTGMLLGPHGYGLIDAIEEVEVLAEIGIVLLLFTIGVELSLKDLWSMKRAVLIGGSIQVLFTIAVVYFISSWVGYGFAESVFIGFLFSLSSTAIVLKLLQKRGELHAPHGRLSLAILLYQDVIVVPMILVTPFLAGVGSTGDAALLPIIGKGIGLIVLVMASAKWIVPNVLYQITKTRDSELFFLSIIVVCLSVAWLTSSMGLSLALGAFLAGLIISESEYSHQALSNLIPFRDIFMSFFFISIGMLLDIGHFFENPVLFILVAAGVLLLKSLLAGLASYLLGFPLRTAILGGLALAQVGEFSFVLSRFGLEFGILDQNVYQLFLVVSIITMGVTSSVMSISPRVADRVVNLPLPSKFKCGFHPGAMEDILDKKTHLKDHLVIAGFGFNGHTVAKAATVAGIPYLILDTNPETVRKEQLKGELVYYGDSSQKGVLEHADIKNARVLVVCISDPAGTRRTVSLSRKLNPNLHIITRTQYLQEMEPLYALGANEVIPEEFETSIEIFVRLMKRYLIPKDEIDKLVSEIRSDGYEMFRTLSGTMNIYDMEVDIPEMNITNVRVRSSSYVVGKTLTQLGLRKKYGVTILAIRRDSEILASPDADLSLMSGDVVVLMGTPEMISKVDPLFAGGNID
ncbi:cation:proton antiporter [Methanococcoides orientis]|uniref:cation:proton antiporter n=1 Tax=Methanococcoides orientis TaxID=2822137 RepID=UPI001E5C68DD|nr:cation:proton antiporter [Methanococcoides orientis]UGV40170.1 cation:proton antiporter [Methanococcoides orientis]